MGDYEATPLGVVESSLGYHPYDFEILTLSHELDSEHCQMDSLTGAVAS